MNTATIPENAIQIRPVRMNGETIKEFTTICFKTNGWLKTTINRLKIIDEIKGDDANILLDILDKDGSILTDLKINRKHFEYLRRTFKLKVID